ncbi:glycosyl hydrolase family 18 protein [Fulvivirga ulvae]|uniref:glycosyl hydrolase family 18 protein n=1 Tax=Fulvivirga ulvae TaxID=2904245 RepID=UPI001F46F401|nr:glycosyl hydrolase family 18 protein [Fulvivirga ulvae]UII30604.1 glycosyl hydrolase family 18 protein [Fulvivirga ulvae]
MRVLIRKIDLYMSGLIQLSRLMLLLAGVLFLFSVSAVAQEGIKGKLNDFADNAATNKASEKEQKEVEKLSTELKTAQAQIDSAKAERQVIDSIFRAEQEVGGVATNNEAKVIDTLAFEERFFSVKKKTPTNSKREDDWRKKYLFTHTNVYKKVHELDSTKQVFGWHPFWMGTAYKSYNFSLLSTIAYFSYELDPATGGYKSIHDWKTTALIDSAKRYNCDVLLSVTNFGRANNAAFLANQRAQATFINTLISLLKERDADGVNIDFEQIPGSSRAAFNNFIIDLSSSLRSVRKDYKITLAIPALDFDNVYDIPQLNQYIDTYVVMGYEFYGSNSTVAGPVAPLGSGNIWWQYNLESAVNEYITLGIPKSKLLLGLPYYGAEWETYDLRFPSKVKEFIRYPMFRDIRKNHYNSGCCEDEVSKSKFYVYRDSNNNYRQIWYEDSVSLGKKYDWVIENDLGGIGIWALGYDNGYTELWELLANKFALSDKEVVAVAKTRSRFSFRRYLSLAFRVMNNPYTLVRNPRPLFGIFGAIFGLSMGGFFLLYRYGHRLKRVFKLLIKSGITLLILFGVALIFIALQYMGLKEVSYLLGGFVIGVIIFLLFSHRFISEKNLP